MISKSEDVFHNYIMGDSLIVRWPWHHTATARQAWRVVAIPCLFWSVS